MQNHQRGHRQLKNRAGKTAVGAIADRKSVAGVPTARICLPGRLGELYRSIQVKLLRVIETRRFSAVGDTALCHFQGKPLAATNRDLSVEIEAGRFRADLLLPAVRGPSANSLS
jgi:sigma54-dependent transcription regulator